MLIRKRSRDLTASQQRARGPVDLPFLMLVLLLVGMGIVAVFSASFPSAYYEGNSPTYYFMRHSVLAAGGLLCMWLISRINYETYRAFAIPVLVLSILLLILVKVPGIGITSKGANRWIRFPIIGRFQPSEVAKMAIVMVFAAGLSKKGIGKGKQLGDARGFRGVFRRVRRSIKELVPYGAALGVVLFLLYLQPHMSGMIIVALGGASVLFAAGISWWWVGIGGGVIAAGLFALMQINPYMKKRLDIVANPWLDPKGDGYQTIQSLYAVGSGGLLGRGLGKSIQKYHHLPEESNDYIFAIWCEEMGFIGAALVLVLFILLILRGYWLAVHARDKFGALLIVGFTTLTAAQVVLNVAVVTGLVPPTGISLPFFSYGGTALLVQLAEMGIILGVSRQIEAPPLG